jgi:hypothetical protein
MGKIYILIFIFCTFFVTLSSGQTNELKVASIVEFSAYPNPVVNGRLTITTSTSTEKEVVIYNVLGKRVFARKFSKNKQELQISQINSGIYIMKIIEGDRVTTKKLIIK